MTFARILALLAFLLLASPLWSDFTLDDFEGKVEVKSSNSWVALDQGSVVNADAVVRLSGHGLAEFREGKLRLHLNRDGVYDLKALVSASLEVPQASLVALVSEKAAKLIGSGRTAAPVANMGARGSEVGAPKGLDWAEEDEVDLEPAAQETLARIEGLISENSLDEALVAVRLAMAQELAPLPTLRLTKARILAQQGLAASALREALEAKIGADSPDYPASLLLIAGQAFVLQDYELVLSTTKEGLRVPQDAEVAQTLEYLLALAYRGQGEKSTAQELLRRVANEDDSTPVGKQAALLLKQARP